MDNAKTATQPPVEAAFVLIALALASLSVGAGLFGWGAISIPANWWAIGGGCVVFWNSIVMFYLAARVRNMQDDLNWLTDSIRPVAEEQ